MGRQLGEKKSEAAIARKASKRARKEKETVSVKGMSQDSSVGSR